MKALILAAGVGSRLAPLTDDRPKVLVDVLGRCFLLRQIDRLVAAGIAPHDIVVVGGYRIDQLRATLARENLPCPVVLNEHYATWNNFYSVLCAEHELGDSAYLQLDGDVILDDRLLPRLIAAPGDAVMAVDVRPELDDETMKVRVSGDKIVAVSKKLDPASCAGEYIGIAKLSATAAREVFAELATLPGEGLTNEYYEGAWQRLLTAGRISFDLVDVHDCSVLEIDTVADLAVAEDILRRRS